MRKEEADVLKREFNAETASADALEFMSSDTLAESEQVLEFLEKYLGTAITDYSLDESHDLLDTDKETGERLVFQRNGRHSICVTPDGGIKAMDPEIPLASSPRCNGIRRIT